MSATRCLSVAGMTVLSLVSMMFPGCGGSHSGSSLSGSFTQSATALAPRLVKIQQKTASGGRVVVDVVIGGPDMTLDMFAFAFDVKIGDGTVAKFVAGSAVAGNALVASGGQTIQANAAPSGADPTDIVVGVSKLGGPPGNGISGNVATVVELSFDMLKAGQTTLTITGSGANPPTCLNSQSPPQPIPSITFDPASGAFNGVSTGGGGY
jgi:hypothetical protein